MSIHPLPGAREDTTPSIEQEELRGISRTVAEIHWLLLILVLLYTIFGGDQDKEAEASVLAALFFYVAFVLSFRYANFYRRESRWKVAIETWAMIGFITWVLYFTSASPARC
jgi:TRAP-type C4-dicarboxylate transport system permease large subunit